MKKLKQNDLFKHIDQFLKDKGIEIREAAPLGSRIKTGCQILTDTINNAQSTLGKAKDHMDDHLDTMRSIIHEKTAPRKASKAAPKKKGKKAATKAKKKAKAKEPAPKKAASPKKTTKKKGSAPKKSRSTAKKAAKQKVNKAAKKKSRKS